MTLRRFATSLACIVVLVACGDAAPEDEFAALIPQLDAALSVISQALVCPGSDVVDVEFDPLEVGSLEEHGQRVPDQVAPTSSMSLVRAGERTRVAIWNDATARPVAMLVMWEFEDGNFGLRRIRYCGS